MFSRGLTVDVSGGEGVGLAVAHKGLLVGAHVGAAVPAAALGVGVDGGVAVGAGRAGPHVAAVGVAHVAAPRAGRLAAVPVARGRAGTAPVRVLLTSSTYYATAFSSILALPPDNPSFDKNHYRYFR